MTYTLRLRELGSALEHLRDELTATDDEVLDLRDRERRLADMDDEDDADLVAKYGTGI